MAAAAPIYQLDFRGHHGVAHGALNSALTTVSAAVVAHLVLQSGFATGLQVALSMLASTVIGLMMIFLWGTVGRTSTPGKVAFNSAALIGSTVWSALVAMATWSTETVLQYGGALIMATVVMGFVAWMMRPLEEEKANPSEDALAQLEQAARDDLGAEWKLRLQRVLRLEAEIDNIENFPHRTKDGELVGYTVEARLASGGTGWKAVSDRVQELSNDLDLPPGCDISVRMGNTRRTALIDVTIRNTLCDEAPYPKEYKKRSVYDPLIIGLSRRNEPCGPVLRERNLAIYGMGGSGKSNAGRVILAGEMMCTDLLTCVIDMTGLRLAHPLIKPFLEGRVEAPGVYWVAFDEQEAFLMLRAMDRGALARNNHYNDLKADHDDDKMPCSEQYPAFSIMCDEVKYIAGRNAVPRLYDLFKKITDDHRDAGFRARILALRGTDEIVKQDIEAQMHAVGVLKAKSVSEYRWAFGTSIGDITPQDAPYPGCIQMRMDPAEEINPYHVYRIKPQQLDDIVLATAGWQPEVDEITLNAMNGRDINGEPFDDLEDGELDCVTGRWDRLRAYLGERGTSINKAPGTSPAKAKANFDQIMGKLQQQTAEVLDTAYEAANYDIDRRVDEFDVDATLAEIFKDFPEPMRIQEATSEEVSSFEMIYKIICDAGSVGIKVSEILARLEEQHQAPDRATLYKWLGIMKQRSYKERIEWRSNSEGSRSGKWYRIGE